MTRLCHSMGLCDLFRQPSTVLARGLLPYLLDNDILSFQTGRVLSPSTLFFFSLLPFPELLCHVRCSRGFATLSKATPWLLTP